MGEMAKKISKLENQELINALNMAFSEEWLAYYQYWLGAKLAKGPMRPSITEEFMEHANEELKHADWLCDRIIQLGGTPTLNPDEWQKVAQCLYDEPKKEYVTNLLSQNLVAEHCAVARYQGICELSFGKDYATYDMSAKILKEELEHEQELEDFIEDIKSGAEHGSDIEQ